MRQIDIKGFETYQITDDGRVWSKKSNMWRKPSYNKDGYLVVLLYDRYGRRHNKPIHRLVAEAFIPNLENKPCVDHINTVRTDNRVENLRWVDWKENSNNELTIQKLYDHKRSCKKVFQYTLEGELIGVFESAKKAAEVVDGTSAGISYCCIGGFYSSLRQRYYECKEYKGYRWSYVPL